MCERNIFENSGLQVLWHTRLNMAFKNHLHIKLYQRKQTNISFLKTMYVLVYLRKFWQKYLPSSKTVLQYHTLFMSYSICYLNDSKLLFVINKNTLILNFDKINCKIFIFFPHYFWNKNKDLLIPLSCNILFIHVKCFRTSIKVPPLVKGSITLQSEIPRDKTPMTVGTPSSDNWNKGPPLSPWTISHNGYSLRMSLYIYFF